MFEEWYKEPDTELRGAVREPRRPPRRYHLRLDLNKNRTWSGKGVNTLQV